MKPNEIHINDWMRILLGEVPPSFLIEILFRAAFVYILLIISIRLMGRRMAGQFSRNELAAMVSLAAAVGVPIGAPDRGLLPAAAIAVIVVCSEKLLSGWAYSHPKVEKIVYGDISILVEDGILCLDTMKKVGITRERLFGQLRSQGVLHLGKVKRLYIEVSGSFTLIQEDEPKAGLSVLPSWDNEFNGEQNIAKDIKVCHRCGKKAELEARDRCINCNGKEWELALS